MLLNSFVNCECELVHENVFPNNKSSLMHSFILMTAGSSDTVFILSIYYIFPSLLIICDSLYNEADHCDELLYNFIIITLMVKAGRCVSALTGSHMFSSYPVASYVLEGLWLYTKLEVNDLTGKVLCKSGPPNV